MSTTTDEQAPMTDAQLQSVVALLDDQEYAGRGATRIDKQDLADLVSEVLRLRNEATQNVLRFAWLEWAMTSSVMDDESLRAWIKLEDLNHEGKSLVDAIDQLRAERREK